MEALGRSTLCSEATRDDFKNICKNMQIVSFVETKSTLRTMVSVFCMVLTLWMLTVLGC